MTDEMKEFLLVWGLILIVVGIVTKFVHGLYQTTVFNYVAMHLGPSLASSLFWISWTLFLLLTYSFIAKLLIYNDWHWRVKGKIKELEDEEKE